MTKIKTGGINDKGILLGHVATLSAIIPLWTLKPTSTKPCLMRHPNTVHQIDTRPEQKKIYGANKKIQEPTERDKRRLIDSCYKGQLKTVKRFIEHGISVNCLHESTGTNPLLAACKYGRLDVVRFLLKEGADPNSGGTWKFCPPHSTSLEMACRGGYLDTVKLILKAGAELEKKGYWKPIKSALTHGHSNIVGYLLKQGAMVNDDTLLCQAVRSGNIDCVRLLIQAGVKLNGKKREDWTALHTAAHLKSPEITEFLIAAGAKIDVPTPHTRETALHLAAKRGNIEAVKALVKAGADVGLLGWKKKNAEQWARAYKRSDVADWLRSYRKVKTSSTRQPCTRVAKKK